MTNQLIPKNEQDVSDIIKGLAEKGETVRISGGSSKLTLGQTVTAQHMMSVKEISGVLEYNPGSQSLVVKPGTPLEELNKILAEGNQRLAFEPMDHRKLLHTEVATPTIGGIVACAVSGSARIRLGACRDSFLGVRFVNGQGEIIKNGGQVMKNVTGYDLVKFMCGSYGTLGVITEISFKTIPLAEYEATLMVYGLDDATAVDLLSTVLQRPLDVTGAAHLPMHGVTAIRVEGLKSFVQTRIGHIQDILKNYNARDIQTIDQDMSCAHWQKVRDVTDLADKPGDVWKISLKPTDGPKFVTILKEKLSINVMYDWGGGLIWLNTDGSSDSEEAVIRSVISNFEGYANLIRASEARRSVIPVFHPEPAPLRKIADEVRKRFDPKSILNPGLMNIPIRG